jgi:hypothetical protein
LNSKFYNAVLFHLPAIADTTSVRNMKAGHNLYDLYLSLKDDTKKLAGMTEIIAVGENIADQ